MRLLRSLVYITLAVVLGGCVSPDPNLQIQISKQANPWTHLRLNNDPNNFQFAIVSDRTGGHRVGVFGSAVEKLNLLRPEFVMCIGDLIEGGVEDESELQRQWNEFDSLVDRLQMPFFYVPGNHDITNEVMAKKWRQQLGRSYYHFTYRGVLFLCLNTEDPPASNISDRQLDYFRNVLNANKNVRWTLVFMHKPMWAEQSSDDWPKFEQLLAGRAYTVFCGHKHEYSKVLRNGRRYYVLATTGGSGGDNLENRCQFDHVVWVTMTDAGPAMANLLLEGILDDEPCVSPQ